MTEQLAAWLAADPHNPVILIGALLVLAIFAYGIAAEMRR